MITPYTLLAAHREHNHYAFTHARPSQHGGTLLIGVRPNRRQLHDIVELHPDAHLLLFMHEPRRLIGTCDALGYLDRTRAFAITTDAPIPDGPLARRRVTRALDAYEPERVVLFGEPLAQLQKRFDGISTVEQCPYIPLSVLAPAAAPKST